ncbi:TMEM165/GDT1 family protein [Candidatus Peregrinibacteria bacterium]|nr:TMEM165/GDT1 family protein [Candidatus Peregrinibacteria bacterium]
MYEFLAVLFSTFGIVFVGELGDKTQVAAGTGALANRRRTRWIFAGSAAALTCVALLTTVGAGLIPRSWLPVIEVIGGIGLIVYGLYLAYQAWSDDGDDDEKEATGSGWALFWAQFWIVVTAEMGDKTQVFTLGAAIQNEAQLAAVFFGSASALVAVTALTVWGVSFIPKRWIKPIQVGGALVLVAYGIYMVA